MKKTIIRALLFAGAAAAVISCGSKGSSTTAAQVERTYKVETYVTVAQDVPQDEVYTSTVQAYVVNNIVPQSAGRIKKINVEVSDFVKKGQVLAEMDAVNLEQARLNYVNDSIELARNKGLYEEGGLSKSELDNYQLAYDISKTNYDNLLENTILESPIDGVVTARNYDQGDMYSGSNPLYVVQQIVPVKLIVGISETEYTNVKVGDTILITADALPGETFSGRVNRIYPTINSSSHTFSVEVIVPNNDRRLRPGMYARTTVHYGTNHSVVVPDNAIVKQQGSAVRMVYVVQPDNTVKSQIVTLGRHFDETYEILTGLEEGVTIVTKGSANLSDGYKIETE